MKKIKWERFERHLREALGALANLHDYAKAVDLVREKNDACISMFPNELDLGFIESMSILKIMKKSGLLLDAAGD